MPLHIEWDATGLFNAIALGLQVGDVLSGSDLYFDANGNKVQVAGEYWKARTADGNINTGEEIEVLDVQGLVLRVKRKK